MQALLDEQIAARIKAECRDACELHRFQRGVWILAQVLDAMGLPKTAKAFHQLRARAGEIPFDPPPSPPEPVPVKLFELPAVKVTAENAEGAERKPLTQRLDALAEKYQPAAAVGNVSTRKRRRKDLA